MIYLWNKRFCYKEHGENNNMDEYQYSIEFFRPIRLSHHLYFYSEICRPREGGMLSQRRWIPAFAGTTQSPLSDSGIGREFVA